jgi:bifunctional lysine-specific demethylase and histidyl-hydroxylase MINA
LPITRQRWRTPDADDDSSVSVNSSFREIISPISPEEFFGSIWDQRPIHISGSPEKFQQVFSWQEFNHLLNMSKLWSDRSMKIVLDGQNLDFAEYGRVGQTREGYQANMPDPEQTVELLRRGATLILDLIESLSPRVAAVSAALQTATGGVAVCNAYCSWRAHQGFMAHFDNTDVFALHIEGSKIWRVYDGRADNAIDAPGHNYGSFTPEHHARAKGALLEEIEMKPGDVLYLPRGQYHEALACSDASLHLSFGIGQPTGIDVVSRLLRSLPDESLFRENLPHFDRPQAHREHLQAIADRIHEILGQSSLSDQIREWQRSRALSERYGRFNLPSREQSTQYRVRSLGVRVESRAGTPVLALPGQDVALSLEEADAAAWIISRDYVEESELTQRFADVAEDNLQNLLDRLERISVLDRI